MHLASPLLLLLAAGLVGCAGNGSFRDSDPGDDDLTLPDDDDTEMADDDTSSVGDDDHVEHVPGVEDAADWLFGLDQVHHVELELCAESLASLAAWPEDFAYDIPSDYVPGAVVIDGERLDDVAVRLKGRWGSYRGTSTTRSSTPRTGPATGSTPTAGWPRRAGTTVRA